MGIPEIFSVFTFNDFTQEPWSIRSDHKTGELAYLGRFDPLGLMPEDPAELKEMQTKELNNGRLAMIAIAGMVAQEAASSSKLVKRPTPGTLVMCHPDELRFPRAREMHAREMCGTLRCRVTPAYPRR